MTYHGTGCVPGYHLLIACMACALVALGGAALAQDGNPNHAATGIDPFGSSAGTGSGTGGFSRAAGAISTPSGFTATGEDSWFVGAGIVTDQTAPGGKGMDGAAFGGVGFSLAPPVVYGEGTVTICDLSEGADWAFSGSLSLRLTEDGTTAFGVGVEGIREVPGQIEQSPYVVLTHIYQELAEPVVVSAGWGDGRFNNSLFGAVALLVTDQSSLIAEYDGQGGNVGWSYGFSEKPLVVTLAWINIFGTEEDSSLALGAGVEFD